MKKVIVSFLVTAFLSVTAFAGNVPKVNNHGFPQNIKSTPKETVIELVQEQKQNEEKTVAPVKATKKRVQKKNAVAQTEKSIVFSEEKTVVEQEVKPLAKKEMKKVIKDVNKPAKKGNGGLSIAAFVLSLTFPIVGLILGYVAKGHDGKNIWNQLAIIFGWIFTAIILLYFVGYVVLLSILLAE